MKRFHLAILAFTMVVVAVVSIFGVRALGLLALPVVFGTLFSTDDVVRYLVAQGLLDGAGGVKLRIKPKTADYTILTPSTAAGAGDASGTIFTNRAATAAVVFTLPAPAAALAGVFYEFLGIADYAITVATATADTFILLNDITADSLAMSTATKLIGSHMRVICDGTSWIAYGDAVGGTFTVAT